MSEVRQALVRNLCGQRDADGTSVKTLSDGQRPRTPRRGC